MYKGVSKSFWTESVMKKNIIYMLRKNTKGFGGKTY